MCSEKKKVPLRVDLEVTIYRNAVRNDVNKSSSSEDNWIMDTDTSDEQILNEEGNEISSEVEANLLQQETNTDVLIDSFISENRPKPPLTATITRAEQVRPLTSGW